MIYLYLSNILPFLFKSIILSTFFFLQINSNLYAGVISYKANFEVSYAGDPSDVFPYGYPEAAKCRIIPLEINISISNDNIVSGEIINKYSEFNDYMDNEKNENNVYNESEKTLINESDIFYKKYDDVADDDSTDYNWYKSYANDSN